jgi:nucleotide-binding universal stress UspA family protein
MTDFPTRILLATDGSEDAAFAARSAVNLANKTGSELHVVYVEEAPRRLSYSEPSSFEELIDPEFEEKMRQHAQAAASQRLEEQVQKIEEAGGEVSQTHTRLGRPDAEIVHLAEELDAGIAVVGSRGVGGVRRALLGSVSDSVVRHAHCLVLAAAHSMLLQVVARKDMVNI